MEEEGQFESSGMENSADEMEIGLGEGPDSPEMELCQQLADSLSISTLTHSLTPIPSLTDRTISISRNTNSLSRDEIEYDTDDMNANVKLTNWTTVSFCTSTEDMISSGIFDSDNEASENESIESLPRESVTSDVESARKWQDISTSDHQWEEDDVTLVASNRRLKKTVESSSEDEPRPLRKYKLFNIRRSDGSESSYPHSSNRTCSDIEDYEPSSTPTSDIEDDPTTYSVSKVTTRTWSNLDDSLEATCSSISSDISVADNIFDEETAEYDKNIEHNMIATRYGLPYDLVECNCHNESQMRTRRVVGIKVCKSGSCHKFEEKFGELDGRAIRLWHTSKRLNGYKRACRIYNSFLNKPDERKEAEFRSADYKLKVNYPNYWVYLSEKYRTFLNEDQRQKEKSCKEKVVEFCKRVLKEQDFFSQHYQVKMRDFGENVKFSVDCRYLHKDFKAACSFLMKEYPSLFEHLIDKYEFHVFAAKRVVIEENRLRFISYSKKLQQDLEELEHLHYHQSLEKIRSRHQV
ncbi:uncharacterized protein LOC123685568 [Harmonia axyridis]|uniref:uncharacterized protein LOC123685568 n=1 Tax=Harmonia axyridis TaxID=115357 RepID=UPI001E27507C|nr:uncharacterized protein LOC123685568 [Harmonia axyridis]